MDTAYFQAQPFYWVICSTSLPSIVSSGLSGARLWRGVMSWALRGCQPMGSLVLQLLL